MKQKIEVLNARLKPYYGWLGTNYLVTWCPERLTKFQSNDKIEHHTWILLHSIESETNMASYPYMDRDGLVSSIV